METMMSDQKFVTGDRVRVAAKPEWGIGTITKVEIVNGLKSNGHVPQRLSVRFPNGGIKTLVTGHADLQRVSDAADQFTTDESPSARYWDKVNESDWLGSMARRKIEEAMLTLPQDVRDPFNSLQKRLSLTLGLYRFDRSGRGLMDWAVAQTGLDDPLSRFTRHELEQKFERWVVERDSHLQKLLQEAQAPGRDRSIVATALKEAPPAAVNMVRRLISSR
jgi:hypothetical protein